MWGGRRGVLGMLGMCGVVGRCREYCGVGNR